MSSADRLDSRTAPAELVRAPILILSDLHMAHPATYLTDTTSLAPILEGVRSVLFNGDTCELAHRHHGKNAREKLQAIAQVCNERGARPFFLTGNHDQSVSSLHDLFLFDGKVVVTHGDILHPWLAPWARDSTQLKRERQRLLSRRPPPATWQEKLELCKEIASIAARYHAKGKKGLFARMLMVGKFAVEPWRAIQAIHYWANVVHSAHALQAEHFPQAKLVVIGHTHRAGVWHLPDFTLVNTGSFQPMSKPLAVRLEERTARVFSLERIGAEWRYGAEVHHMSFDG